MTKRFTITQNGDLFTVRDTVKNKPMGVFEFKEDEFPVYFCFHKIIDLMNDLNDENKQLEEENEELNEELMECDSFKRLYEKKIERLEKENEQLKEGMIGVVDRYIRNVEHNPPSSARTYLKVKGALVNVREGLRDLLERV